MSLVFLCYCSRRGGGSSYGEVVRSAFGEKMEQAVSMMVCTYIMFSILAYMVLARDVWTPLVHQMLGNEDLDGDYILLALIGMLVPLLFQRSLHALRNICYVGFTSIFVLCIALCHGGWKNLNNKEEASTQVGDDDNGSSSSSNFQIEIFKIPSPADLLYCFPIITCAFLCQFNINTIQNAISKPTRERIENLTQYAIGASCLLMYSFGLGGYIYAGNDTKGNILLNVPMTRTGNAEDDGDYYIFLVGRIGYGLTILMATPMILLPCRDALLEMVDVWYHRSHHKGSGENSAGTNNETCCWRMLHKYNTLETAEDANITTEDEVLEITMEEGQPAAGAAAGAATDNEFAPLIRENSIVLIRQNPIQNDYVFRNALAHYGSTLAITACCYLGAVAVSGVAAVWSFIGSSMAFFIAFVVPCGCFIRIESNVPSVTEGGDRKDGWISIARCIMWFSIVGAVICTVNNTVGFGV